MAEKLGSILVRKQLITPQQLEDALKLQVIYGGRVGTNLIELGYLDIEALSQALAEQMHIPEATVAEFEATSAATLALIPRDLAEKHCAFPLRADGRRLVAAVASAFDFAVIDELGFTTGMRIVPKIAPELRIALYLERRYGIERKSRYIRLADEPVRPHIPAASAPAPVDRRASLTGTPSPFARLREGEYLSAPEFDEYAPAPGVAAAPAAAPQPPTALTSATPRPLVPPAAVAGPAPVRTSGPLPAAPAAPRVSGPLPAAPAHEDPVTTARRAALLGSRAPATPPGAAPSAEVAARRAALQSAASTPIGRMTPGGLPPIAHRAPGAAPAAPPVLQRGPATQPERAPAAASPASPGVSRSLTPPNGLAPLPAISRTATPPAGIALPNGVLPLGAAPTAMPASIPATSTPAPSVAASGILPLGAAPTAMPAGIPLTATPPPSFVVPPLAPVIAPAAAAPLTIPRRATPPAGFPAVVAPSIARTPTPPAGIPAIVAPSIARTPTPPAGLPAIAPPAPAAAAPAPRPEPTRAAEPAAPVAAAARLAPAPAAPPALPWDLEPELPATPPEGVAAFKPIASIDPVAALASAAEAAGSPAAVTSGDNDWFLAPVPEPLLPSTPTLRMDPGVLEAAARLSAPPEPLVAQATEPMASFPTDPSWVDAIPASAAPMLETPASTQPTVLEREALPVAGLFHVEEAFGRATTREKVAETLLWFAQGRFSTAALLSVQDGRAEGWVGFGDAIDPARIAKLSFAIEPGSLLARAASAGGAVLDERPQHEADRRLLQQLGLDSASSQAAIAIAAHGSVVAVLIGSRGCAPLRDTTAYELDRAAATASRALDRIAPARRG